MSKETINYDDFIKLDIKIGTITEVEIVEGADRLLKLTVDTGDDDSRQIISGIREYFENIQELVGKQCPFLVNLEPRIIRGLESQGMILAAGSDEVFSLLHPATKLESGTLVQ